MTKVFIFSGIILFILSLISADNNHDYNYHNHRNIRGAFGRFVNTNMALTGRYLYEHLKKYPQQSYSIVTLPIFCMVGHLAHFAKGEDYRRLMRFLKMKNKKEIKQVLSYAVRQINRHPNTKAHFAMKVYGDVSKKFYNLFKEDIEDISGGESGYLNYRRPYEALYTLRNWFMKQSPYPPQPMNIANLLNDVQGLIYTSSIDFVASFDHIANPNAIIYSDFYVTQTETIKLPVLSGIGLFKYAEIDYLDAKIIIIYLKGGKHYGCFVYPNNPDNLEELLGIIQDPKVFYTALGLTRWMCLNVHITIGHTFAVNKILEFIPNLRLNTTNFQNVYQSGGSARVIDMIQQLHLIGDTEVRKGQLNSKLCPDENPPSVVMNHPCAYYVFDSFWMNVYAGILYGPQNYGI